MTAYVFDVETDGLLDTLTRIHCLWLEDVETGERAGYGPGILSVAEGVAKLATADVLYAHNGIKFDFKVLDTIYPGIDRPVRRDTLVLSRLLWPDLRKTDKGMGKLTGAHSLRAWGQRLRVAKGDYDGGWDAWNPEMHAYCEQDVVVTRELLRHIQRAAPAETAVVLEHRFAEIMARMEENGFGFNEAAAGELLATLTAKRIEIAAKLQLEFPPETIEETITPKASNKKLGRVKGVPYVKRTVVEFNPSSRQQVARRLQALGWVPQEFTDNGQPKVDETILASIYHPSAKLLAEHFLVEKRIGQISEGDQAWLKAAKNGVIHGAINPNGAVTGRCTHSRPNVSQVPKVGSPFGVECRALWRPTRPGWVQVGADLSGIELRCKAHYLHRFDGGAYAKVLLEGDVHWANVQAMGLAEGDRDDTNLHHKIARNAAKTFIYAFLYGCGNHKAGTIVYEFCILPLKDAGLAYEGLQKRFFGHLNPPTDDDFVKAGTKLKARFLRKMPALSQLIAAVQEKVAKSGHLIGLDGRRLGIRAKHSALNTLLQCAGSLIAKQATILAYDTLNGVGYEWGRDWALMAHVHDELQIECRPEIAEEVGKIVTGAMEAAGIAIHIRVPIAGEYHVGNNWFETH